MGPVAAWSDLPTATERAGQYLRLQLMLGREGTRGTVRELGLHGLLLSGAERADLDRYLEAALGPLERYDVERGTDLLVTAQAFFDHDGHVSGAATELFIHANTMYQRLERIDAVLGADWRTGDTALELRMALRLRALTAD